MATICFKSWKKFDILRKERRNDSNLSWTDENDEEDSPEVSEEMSNNSEERVIYDGKSSKNMTQQEFI